MEVQTQARSDVYPMAAGDDEQWAWAAVLEDGDLDALRFLAESLEEVDEGELGVGD